MSMTALAASLIVLTNSFGRVEIDPHGACVRSYVPAGGCEVFYPVAAPDASGWRAGGVPVCWPWFFDRGPSGAGLHGLARNLDFSVVCASPDAAELELVQGALKLRMGFKLGPALSVSMSTENCGADPLPVTGGLHAYFAVADVSRATLDGLTGLSGTTKRGGAAAAPCAFEEKLPLAGANDICDVKEGVFEIDDPAGGRRIRLEASGMGELVVWNGRACPHGAVCVEPVVFRNPLVLAPGERHKLNMSAEVLPK